MASYSNRNYYLISAHLVDEIVHTVQFHADNFVTESGVLASVG